MSTPLVLEAGAFYVDVEGCIVGPMRKNNARNYFVGKRRSTHHTEEYIYAEDGAVASIKAVKLVKRYVATLRVGARYKRRDGEITDISRVAPQSAKFMYVDVKTPYLYEIDGSASRPIGQYVYREGCSDLTHEVLPDGTEIPLPATWEEHDAYVAGTDVSRRAIEMVAADVPGKYLISRRSGGLPDGGLITEILEVRQEHDDLYLYTGKNHLRIPDEVPSDTKILARVLPNGTQVPIGSLMIELEEAMKKDAAIVPHVEPASEEEVQRFQAFNERLKVRRESNRLTSMDIACGFVPEHWKRVK